MRKYDIELNFFAAGATDEEMARGEAAAWAVFEAAGVNPWVAAAAAFKQEGDWESITNEEGDLAELWREAEHVAIAACCDGWRERPLDVNLELVRDADATPKPT